MGGGLFSNRLALEVERVRCQAELLRALLALYGGRLPGWLRGDLERALAEAECILTSLLARGDPVVRALGDGAPPHDVREGS